MVISILCGGSGTRLWPLSRTLLPKQFAKLIGQDSLFKQTLVRNKNLLGTNDSLQIITNEQHYFLALDIAQSLGLTPSFIVESVAKNTAAALTLAAMKVVKEKGNDVIVTLPSDHIIHDDSMYCARILEACKLAMSGAIVTFGIKPTKAHTGYGYIQADKSTDSATKPPHNTQSYKVAAFHEKPDKARAESFLEQGNFYWNSGMFCYEAQNFLQEIKQHAPEIYELCMQVFELSSKLASNTANLFRLDKEASKNLIDTSIDYALMEKTKKLAMMELGCRWNDVGSFESLYDELPKDSNKNATNNACITKESSNNLIMADKMVATLGLHDCVVIDTYDALLVAKKGHTQEIKSIVAELKAKGSALTEFHNQVFRPWGSYTVLQESSTFKLKSIHVKPKQRLSLQKHYHRNEHWIVVSGSALVQIGDDEIFLAPNQSTYIPMGQIHRLTNPGTIDLIMIEVQVGEYLGEDDIVRLSDDYTRV